MDGTLVDSMPTHGEAFAKILGERYHVRNDLSRKVYFGTAGQPLDVQFQQALKAAGKENADNVQDLVDVFWSLIRTEHPQLFPHVKEVLISLQRCGYRIFVSSGCVAEVVKAKMISADIESLVTLMLGTDYSLGSGIGKGENHFRAIQDYLGLDESEFRNSTVMTGDTEYDMALGKKAGLATIGAAMNGQTESLLRADADAVFDDWRQFESTLLEL